MKTPILASLCSMAFTASLPAALTITVANYSPNGTASGGTGSGVGAYNTSSGVASTDRGLPVTTYTISNVDLTSVGGTATESFTFTLTYNQTGGSAVQFNAFGNVSITGGDNNQIEVGESLTATIALTNSSFADLSLLGFTKVRAGGVSTGETGTFTYDGGVGSITSANREPLVSGNSVTLNVNNPMNFEGFTAEFMAVPEPASTSLIAVGALAMLRRRR